MKKCFRLLIIIIPIFVITGCGFKNTQTVSKSTESKLIKVCTLNTADVENGYVLDAEYSIYGSDNEVNKVITLETVTSDNETLLNQIKNNLNNTNSTMNQKYGGYTSEITKDNGKLVSKTTTDYDVINMKKFIKDNTALKGYLNSNNKFTIDGITTLYESMGAICK